MTGHGLVRRLLPLGLSVLVLGLVGYVTVAPQSSRPSRPPNDLPAAPGYRVVWGEDSRGRTLRADDVVLEIVRDSPTPFTPHFPLLTHHVATMARWSDVAVIVALGDVEFHEGFVPTISARAVVERVVMNRLAGTVAVGASLPFWINDSASERRVGGTRVVTRAVWARLPQPGRRYLWFLREQRGRLIGMGRSGLFEIRDRAIVPTYQPNREAWRRHLDTERALAIVRHMGSLPALDANAGVTPALLAGLAP